jgi:hypothetical protein
VESTRLSKAASVRSGCHPDRCSEALGHCTSKARATAFFSRHLSTEHPMNSQRSPAARVEDDGLSSPKRKKVRSKYAPKAWYVSLHSRLSARLKHPFRPFRDLSTNAPPAYPAVAPSSRYALPGPNVGGQDASKCEASAGLVRDIMCKGTFANAILKTTLPTVPSSTLLVPRP